MSKHDLQARPVYHHKRESIDAHLTIVFAALAISHWIEHQTGWSIKKFVRTARRYRTVQIKAGRQILTAADPLPDDLRDALAKINAEPCTLNCPKSGRTGFEPFLTRVLPGAGARIRIEGVPHAACLFAC